MHVTNETLEEANVEFSDDSACCVVMASNGYPKSYEKGFEITIPDNNDKIFIAGAKLNDNGKLITSGGRVLGVTETAETLDEAISRAYETVSMVHFDNSFYRKDIGKKALDIRR